MKMGTYSKRLSQELCVCVLWSLPVRQILQRFRDAAGLRVSHESLISWLAGLYVWDIYLKCAKVHTIYQPVFCLPHHLSFFIAPSASALSFSITFPPSLFSLYSSTTLLIVLSHEFLQHGWWQNLTSFQQPQIDVLKSREKCFILYKWKYPVLSVWWFTAFSLTKANIFAGPGLVTFINYNICYSCHVLITC